MTTFATTLAFASDPVKDFMFGKGGPNAGQAGSAIAAEADWLFMVIFWISMASFALLMGLVLFMVIKYRARPGVPSQRTVSHNTPLELFWSVVPLVIMTWMFFEGFWTYMDMQTVKAGAEPISVNASTWLWRFTYPNGATSQEEIQVAGKYQPVFVVPAGVPVQLTMTSSDAIHSFWVPAFRNKRDVFPNRYTTLNFEALPLTESDEWSEPDAGVSEPFNNLLYQYRDHYVFCAEFCGDQHSEMAAIIRVVEPEVYTTIINSWGEISDEAPIEEQLAFWSRYHGCVSCHTLDGTPGTGPTWRNLYGYTFDYDTGSKTVDEDHIRRAIYEPAVDIRDGFLNQMTVYAGQIPEEQLETIIRGLQAISDKGPKSPLGDPGSEQNEEGGEPGETTDPSGQTENEAGNETGTSGGGA